MQRQRGLTLLELLVVLTIIGFAMAGVSLALRDTRQTQLEREAQRLVAILEAARAQSRTSGIALIWQTTPEGFAIGPTLALAQPAANTGGNLPHGVRHHSWLNAGTQAVVNTANPWVLLGPEPIVAPTRLTLSVAGQDKTPPAATLSIGTDGLRPFQVVP